MRLFVREAQYAERRQGRSNLCDVMYFFVNDHSGLTLTPDAPATSQQSSDARLRLCFRLQHSILVCGGSLSAFRPQEQRGPRLPTLRPASFRLPRLLLGLPAAPPPAAST